MSEALLDAPGRPPAPPPRRLYPERPAEPDGKLDTAARWTAAAAGRIWHAVAGHGLRTIVRIADRHADGLAGLDEDGLTAEIAALRGRLHGDGLTRPAVGYAFALVREVAARTLGQRPYDVQLMGGYALLKGTVAEMQTGEGKTLTATLPVATAALAGIPVHVITANDYLAARDAEAMAPLYARLGLSVGTVVEDTPAGARRAIYRRDIVYATNKQIAFDYLRDRMVLRKTGGDLALKMNRLHADRPLEARLTMRGLHFAVVDEADSVLIDEARTPLIISGTGGQALEKSVALEALEVARRLVAERDYTIHPENGVELLEPGRTRVDELAADFDWDWLGARRRAEFVEQALSALHLYRRDEHYLVRDGKVVIVDEFTGRTMADRFWGQGLHQMVEAKEGVETTAGRTTLAQMTYQRFFRRYARLAGMSGTVREVAGELSRVYRLPVVRIPTNRPVRRRRLRGRVFADADTKWAAVARRAAELQAAGRPVLIGTRTVASSTAASDALQAADVRHAVLSAAQDADEAAVIAAAGLPGAVTVATNMAGRGTDILLAEPVRAAGGLHVMICELNDARRIDRQLAGRAGRQGDPGSYEVWLSADDPLLEGPGGQAAVPAWLARTVGLDRVPQGAAHWALGRAQRRLEHTHARVRAAQLRIDRQRVRTMAFTGRGE